MLVQELKSMVPLYPVHGLKKYHVLGMLGRSFLRLRDFYAQYRMRSAKLKNHLNHKIVTTKVWDEKI